ncbi:SH2 domain-containing protein [Aphelenchoides besseyi]|nr:SH2 domain-containing protein [Aphelenchoides besseyi]
MGSADVNIGGKQTKFFLHCEASDPSNPDGVWVVKSHSNTNTIPSNQETLNQQVPNVDSTSQISLKSFGPMGYQFPDGTDTQQHPKKSAKMPSGPIICEQNLQAREQGSCNVPEACLQPNVADAGSYLQCNPLTHKWIKKHCQQGFAFNFEHQACIGHPKTFRQHVARQPANSGAGGVVCTYSQCSQSNPCSTGTCNNGYCCSTSPSIAGSIQPNVKPTNKTLTLSNFLTIADDWPPSLPVASPLDINKLDAMVVKAAHDASSCAAGFTSNIRCLSFTQCPPGLFCDTQVKLCCPLLLPLSEVTISPPTTLAPSAAHQHFQNAHHFPSRYSSSKIPPGSRFAPPSTQQHSTHSDEVMSGIAQTFKQRRANATCPGGGAASGSCVSGQCGPGYSCNSGSNVCCAQVVPATVCPDGTQAAGACVNNMCGVGFTCNQGLCCTNSSQTPRCLDGSQAIGACMQGRCGTGFTCTTGNICCPSTLNSCPNGQTSIGTCVNGRCPDGYTCINNQCCGPPVNNANSLVTCDRIDSNGPCLLDGSCPEPGYACDTGNNWCCPQILGNPVGPCITGAAGTRLCPEGYACTGSGVGQCFRINTGTCAPEDQLPMPANGGPCPPGFSPYGGFQMQRGFEHQQILRFSPSDPTTDSYEYPHRPLPISNMMSTQLYTDLGLDSLSGFVQSNQNCTNLYGQLISAKNELLMRQDEMHALNKKFRDANNQGLMTSEDEVRQLHGYIFELEAKVEKLKLHVSAQIETSCHMMSQAMHSLVADKLVAWLVRQKEISCGARSIIRKHYDELNNIDVQFEECGRQIVILMGQLASVEQTLGAEDVALANRICKLRTDLIQGSRQFIWQSLIVSVQPPSVLVKCRGSESYRSTRFPCKTEIRLLGGEALGVRNSATTVRVDLISENMARQIQQDPCQKAIIDQSFHLIYNEANFRLEAPTVEPGMPMYRATFDRIRLVENISGQKRSAVDAGLDEKRGTRRSKVSSLRYYLAYQVQTGPFLNNFGNYSRVDERTYIEVSGYKLSLPVAALVHSSLEADASLFWNRSFAEGTGILSAVPDAVSWEQAKVAINLKWGALIQEPQDVRDLITELPEPRPLSIDNLEHLARRLGVVDGVLHKKNFFNRTVSHKDKDGAPMPCVFFEWYYKCASVINKYMQEQWNDGIIIGFCSKEQSERILRSTLRPTMLIRFSDMVIGYLKISCKLPDHRVVHYETEAEKMPIGTSIADAIRSNPTFAYIQYIYPNRLLSSLWQHRETQGEKRTASWSSAAPPGYFSTCYALENKPVAAIN